MSLFKDKLELEVEMAEYKAKETLNTFPTALRWLLIISIIGIIPGYYLAKNASYKYWSGQYSRYLVAAKKSFSDPKDPKISDITVTTTGAGTFAAVIEVTNENVDLSLPEVAYEFSFQNGKGEQVYREPGKMFLMPNQKKYVVVPRFTSKDPVTAANFKFTSNLVWQKKISIPKAEIQAAVPTTYNQFDPPAFVAEGTYYNSSSYQIRQVSLVFLVYDRSNKIVGISQRIDNTIAPFERRAYKQIWPNVFADSKSRVQIFADTNVLDPTNLSQPPAPADPASSLDRPGTNQER